MMNFLRKHMRAIFIVTVVAFLAGTFMGGGAYLFGPAKDIDSIANVNGEKIPLKLFTALYTYSLDMYRNAAQTDLSQEQTEQLKLAALQSLIQDELFYQQALNYGIIVSDTELMIAIQNSPNFMNANRQFDQNIYYSFLNSLRMTPKDYENLRRKQIAGEKLKFLLVSSVKVSDSEIEAMSKNAKETHSREDFVNIKMQSLLNEWFSNMVNDSKIVTNDTVFRQI